MYAKQRLFKQIIHFCEAHFLDKVRHEFHRFNPIKPGSIVHRTDYILSYLLVEPRISNAFAVHFKMK